MRLKHTATVIMLAFALVAAASAGSPAAAQYAQYYGPGPGPTYQPPRPRLFGFRHRVHAYVGGQLSGVAVLAQSTDYADGYLGSGGGAGLFGGVRLGPFLAIEGNWNVTYHDNREIRGDTLFIDLDALYMMTFSVDGKLHLPTYGPVEPYAQAGIGFGYLGATYGSNYDGNSVLASGPMFNLGVGLDGWLSPWLTVGGRVLYRGLAFGDVSTRDGSGHSNYVSGLSFDVNLALHL
ncbi:MAG: hypothetical protein IPG96_14765 [Proteobacteria bacterium]|nr:hypothetical protein [Pseudomonadota bacterium]